MKTLKLLIAVTLVFTVLAIPFAALQAETAVNTSANGLVAYYQFNDDLTDASGNGMNGTQIGDITFVDGVNGKGARFQGGYIEVEHNDLLNLENGFTFSVWIYKESKKEILLQPILVKTEAEKGGDAYFFSNSQDRPNISAYINNNYKNQTFNKWIDVQKWSLCTVTADSKTIQIFIDGKLAGKLPGNYTFKKSTGKLYIGFKDEKSFGQRFFNGIMDDLKIFNYAMSEAEVKNEYDTIANGTGKYIISRPPGLVAFYRFEGNLNDVSGYGNNGTAVATDNGLTYTYGVAGKALKFDGASYIEVEDSDSLDMDKGFTCSFWVSIDAYRKSGVTNQPIISKLDDDTFLWKGKTAYSAALGYDDRTIIEVHRGSNAETEGQSGIFATPRVPFGWYMVTLTADGKDLKAYINGVLKQKISKSNFIPHSMGKLLIGSNIKGDSFFKGIMDELRIYNYALTPEEIKALYAKKDSLSLYSDKTTLKKGLSQKVSSILKAYSFVSPNPLSNTGAHVIVVNKGKEGIANVDVTRSSFFSSSNTSVIKIASPGKVTAIGAGKAKVTGRYGLYSGSVNFSVTN